MTGVLLGVGRNQHGQLGWCPRKCNVAKRGVRMLQDGEAHGDPDELHGEDSEQGEAAAAHPAPNPDEIPSKVAEEETCGAEEGIESLASSMSTLPSSLSSFSSLGNDEGEGSVSADRVVAKAPLDVKCVAAGQSFTVVCTADGGVFACGVGGGGGGREGDDLVPHKGGERLSRITSLSMYFVTSVACGAMHTLAMTSDGRAMSWGSNRHGQLGLGSERGLEDAEEPQMIVSLSDKAVTGIACGAFHSLAIVSEGRNCQAGGGKCGFFAAGWCLSGQLGLGISTDEACTEFQGVSMPPAAGHVVAASAGYGHSCCLTANGLVYEWGRGDYWWSHGVGHGAHNMDFEQTDWDAELVKRLRPRRVLLPFRAVDVSCGYDHTAVSCVGGQVYFWGGQGGGEPAPVKVDGVLEGLSVTSVHCGRSHTIAVVEGGGGGAFAWGANEHGQTGCAAAPDHVVPARVEQTVVTRRLRSVSSGCCAEHSVFNFSNLLSREAATAVLMGTHHRLGEGSPFQALDSCIVASIARM